MKKRGPKPLDPIPTEPTPSGSPSPSKQKRKNPKGTINNSTTIVLLSSLLLLRTLIGLYPHSGQNNYHGSTVAYGGDYEAQRHWTELTLHLPLSQWYTYDTEYWGLDYPPLSAYGSYVVGLASYYLVGEESVALDESRGYEEDGHRAFMRGTVVVSDVVYFMAVWMIARRLSNGFGFGDGGGADGDGGGTNHTEIQPRSMGTFYTIVVTALSQPALLLIDHGHFQYNSVCLGLSLLSFHYLTLLENSNHRSSSSIGTNAIIGSVLFCLALNWKQMGLYYAPAVFAYLLGRCFSSSSSSYPSLSHDQHYQSQQQTRLERFRQIITNITKLGIAVLTTFAILLLPFVIYRDRSNQTPSEALLIILRRVFPFQRGLFEGKVSNLWCTLSLKPVSVRERISHDRLPPLAMASTLLMALPFCVVLFCIGRGRTTNTTTTRTRTTATKETTTSMDTMTSTIDNTENRMKNDTDTLHQQRDEEKYHLRALLWGSTGVSLSFFLASFQVHEKSILLPLAPLSLLITESPLFVRWFSHVSTWTLWFLLKTDRLVIPYGCVGLVFEIVTRWMCFWGNTDGVVEIGRTRGKDGVCDIKHGTLLLVRWTDALFKVGVVPVSVFVMIGLHMLEGVVDSPDGMPDLFPVLWVVVGCALFCVAWIYVFCSLLAEWVEAPTMLRRTGKVGSKQD